MTQYPTVSRTSPSTTPPRAHPHARSPRLAALLAVVLLMLTACGEKPEVMIDQAELALASGQFQQAVDLAQQVLAGNPEHLDALQLLATAQMRLGRFDTARQTLDRARELAPDHLPVRQLLLEWTVSHQRQLLGDSQFDLDPNLQQQYSVTLTGLEIQEVWFEQQAPEDAQGRLLLARGFELDAERGRIRWARLRALPPPAVADTTAYQRRHREVAAAHQQWQQRVTTALGQVDRLLDLDDKLVEAHAIRARLLAARGAWANLIAQAQRVAQLDDLPLHHVLSLQESLDQIPPGTALDRVRRELARQMLDGVREAERNTLDRHLALARLHQIDHQFDEAREAIDRALRLRPRDAQARFLLAMNHYQQRDFAKAHDVLEALVQERDGDGRVQALWGLTLLELGNRDLAGTALRSAIDLNPADPIAYERLLVMLTEDGRLIEAQPLVQTYYQHNRHNPVVVQTAMNYRLAAGRRVEVQSMLEELAAVESPSPAQLRVLVSGYLRLHEPHRASPHAQRLARMLGDSAESHVLLAQVQAAMGHSDAARELLEKVIDDQAPAGTVDLTLGEMLLTYHQLSLAAQALSKAVEAQPDQAPPRLRLAVTYAFAGQTQMAMRLLEPMFEQAATRDAAHAVAARVAFLHQDFSAASQHLRQLPAALFEPDSGADATLRAVHHWLRGEHEQASKLALRHIVHGHTDPDLRLIAGLRQLQQQQPTLALIHFWDNIHLYPSAPFTWEHARQVYLQEAAHDQGVFDFAQARDRNLVLSMLSQMSLLLDAEKPEVIFGTLRAEELLAELMRQKHPAAMSVADQLARAHLAMRRPDRAQALFKQLQAAGFDSLELQLRQLELIRGDDSLDAVIAQLEALQAAQTQPVPRLRELLIRRYVQADRLSDASALVEKGLAAQPTDPGLRSWRARLLAQQGKLDEAVADLEAALEHHPHHVGLLQQLLGLQLGRGHVPAADAVAAQSAAVDPQYAAQVLAQRVEMRLNVGLVAAATELIDASGLTPDSRVDPGVALVLGQALSEAGRSDDARSWLEQIDPADSVYIPSRMILTHLDMQEDRVDQARGRLSRLLLSSGHQAGLRQALLALEPAQPVHRRLLSLVSEAMVLRDAEPGVRVRWHRRGLQMAMLDADWHRAAEHYRALDQQGSLRDREAVGYIATLLILSEADRATAVFKARPSLHTGLLRDMLERNLGMRASAVDKAPGTTPGRSATTPVRASDEPPLVMPPMLTWLRAVAAGRADEAAAALRHVASHQTLFRPDLEAMTSSLIRDREALAQALARIELAVACREAGQLPLAVRLLDDVVRRHPDLALAHMLRLNMLPTRERHRMLEHTPEVFEPWHGGRFANALRVMESHDQLDDAQRQQLLAILQPLSERVPEHVELRARLSSLYPAGSPEARRELEALIETEGPYRDWARNNLAYSLAHDQPRDLERAHQLASQAVQAHPQNASMIDTLGWIEHQRGNHALAMRLLYRAALQSPTEPYIHLHLGVVHQALEQPQWARWHLIRAAEADQHPAAVQAREHLRTLTEGTAIAP